MPERREGPRLDPADEAAIRRASAAYADAGRAADWERFTSFFDDEPVCMPDNHEALTAPDAIRAFYEAFPKLDALELTPLGIDGSGDLAYEHGRYELRAGAMHDRGKYLHVWRRQSEGAWKLYRNISNSDLPVG